jgi:hypothetical protein
LWTERNGVWLEFFLPGQVCLGDHADRLAVEAEHWYGTGLLPYQVTSVTAEIAMIAPAVRGSMIPAP